MKRFALALVPLALLLPSTAGASPLDFLAGVTATFGANSAGVSSVSVHSDTCSGTVYLASMAHYSYSDAAPNRDFGSDVIDTVSFPSVWRGAKLPPTENFQGIDPSLYPGSLNDWAFTVDSLNLTGAWDPSQIYILCDQGGTAPVFQGTLSSFQIWGGNGSSSGTPDVPTGSQGAAFPLSQCSPDFGWNPFADVGNLFTGLICIGQWLVEPGYTDSTGAQHIGFDTSLVTSQVTDKVPFAEVADVYDGVSSLDQSFMNVPSDQSSVCGGVFEIDPFASLSPNAGMNILSSFHNFKLRFMTPSFCATQDLVDLNGQSFSFNHDLGGSSGIGDFFGYRDLIYNTEKFSLIVAAVAVMYRMVPWARRSSTLDNSVGGPEDI